MDLELIDFKGDVVDRYGIKKISKSYCVVKTSNFNYIIGKKKFSKRMPLYVIDLNNLKVYFAYRADIYCEAESLGYVDERNIEIDRRAVIVKEFVIRSMSLNLFYLRHLLEEFCVGSNVHEDIFSNVKSLIFS